MGVLSWLFGGVEPEGFWRKSTIPQRRSISPATWFQDAALTHEEKEGRPQHLGAGRPSAHDCQQRGDAWSP